MPDSRSFRQIMSCFATGVSVVTARDKDGRGIGITVNSLTSVSLKPPLLLFCLDKSAHVYPIFRNVKYFAVNILGEDQQDVSRHFADYRHYPMPDKMWDRPQGGCPILRHTLGWMVCRKTATAKGGDHDIIVGEVVKLHKRKTPTEPLLYFHSRYRKIGK